MEGCGVGEEIGDVIDSTDTSLLRQEIRQTSSNTAGLTTREETLVNVLIPLLPRSCHACRLPSAHRPGHEAAAAESRGLAVR